MKTKHNPPYIYRVLEWFKTHDGTIAECAKALRLPPSSIASSGTKLQKRGLLRKTGELVWHERSRGHAVLTWTGKESSE